MLRFRQAALLKVARGQTSIESASSTRALIRKRFISFQTFHARPPWHFWQLLALKNGAPPSAISRRMDQAPFLPVTKVEPFRRGNPSRFRTTGDMSETAGRRQCRKCTTSAHNRTPRQPELPTTTRFTRGTCKCSILPKKWNKMEHLSFYCLEPCGSLRRLSIALKNVQARFSRLRAVVSNLGQSVLLGASQTELPGK
jgi:hypothetical protein